MTMRTITILGFVLLGATATVLYLAGRARRFRLVPLSELIDVLRSRPAIRIVLVLVWAWAGWHLLAR